MNNTNLKNFNSEFQNIQQFLSQENVLVSIKQIENKSSQPEPVKQVEEVKVVKVEEVKV